jgi:hypothetical protein
VREPPSGSSASGSILADRRTIVLAALGLVAATGWFAYNLSVGIGNRFRGDAVGYVQIMMARRSLADVLGYAGDRTLGFPLFLYLVKSLTTLAGSVSVETFVDVVCVLLLLIHVVATLLFFAEVSSVSEREMGLRLHPAALALLLAYPGLVAYTAVPLTDTLATDLLMLAIAALCRASRLPTTATRAGWGLACGAGLGAVVLVRPATVVPCAAVLAGGWVVVGTRRTVMTAATLGFALLVGMQAANCARVFDRACLTNPTTTAAAVAESVGWGVASARHYWSQRSNDPDGHVSVPDPFLADHLAADCHPTAVLGRDGLLACLATHPTAVVPFELKKAIGLFDSYYLQPYAVDVTPRWARLVSRPFGALAFAGFVAAVGWLGLVVARLLTGLRLGSGLLGVVLLIPVAHIVWQSLFHVEPRYGFPAVPFALVSLTVCVQRSGGLAPRRRALVFAVLAGAILLFLGQTYRWDVGDDVLRRIEAG